MLRPGFRPCAASGMHSDRRPSPEERYIFMKSTRFFWKLFLGNAALLVLALLISVSLIVREFDRFHHENVTRLLQAHAAALVDEVGARGGPAARGSGIPAAYGSRVGLRVPGRSSGHDLLVGE